MCAIFKESRVATTIDRASNRQYQGRLIIAKIQLEEECYCDRVLIAEEVSYVLSSYTYIPSGVSSTPGTSVTSGELSAARGR